MNEKLKGGLFSEAEPRYELRGWQLRRFRLKLGKTQEQFAREAGWSRDYQTKIEAAAAPILTTASTRETVEAVFRRWQRYDPKFWHTCMKSFTIEPSDLSKKIFVEHKRFTINGNRLCQAIEIRPKADKKNLALLTGWSIGHIRKLCSGDVEVVTEQAAIKIMCALVSLQDEEQV